MNDKLRQQVRMLKALQNIKYKEIAEYLEMNYNGFLLWLNGHYDLGNERQTRLNEIIANIWES